MASREGPPQASSRQAAEDRRAGGVSGSPFAIMRPSGKQWYTNLIPVVPPEIDGFLIDSPSPIPTLERWHSPEPPPQQSIASGGRHTVHVQSNRACSTSSGRCSWKGSSSRKRKTKTHTHRTTQKEPTLPVASSCATKVAECPRFRYVPFNVQNKK